MAKTGVKAEPVAQPAEPGPVNPRMPGIYGVAEAKRGSDIQARRAEITAMERGMNQQPMNPDGIHHANHMRSQIVQVIADKRAALEVVESMTPDEVVRHYSDVLTSQPGIGLCNSDGSPLRRGAVPSSVAPGMTSHV